MKSQEVITALSRFISGEREEGMRIVNIMACGEKSPNVKARLTNLAARQLSPLRKKNGTPLESIDTSMRPELVLAKETRLVLESVAREHAARSRLAENGIRNRNRILLKGSPGNGKTSFAKLVACDLGVPLYVVSLAQVIDSHMGQSAKSLEKAFEFANAEPCVLLIDEADSVCGWRKSPPGSGSETEDNRTISQFLLSLDQMSSSTVLILATNYPNAFDSAIARRIDFMVEMPKINAEGFWHLYGVAIRKWPSIANTDWKEMEKKFSSYDQAWKAFEDNARTEVLQGHARSR